MNFLESIDDEEIFSYFDVQNLSIDHSLISSEINQYKDLIFSPNSLQQIYFKGSSDIDSIEIIKNLLSISEFANDAMIDKYILLDLTDSDIDRLLNSTYEFPDTWKLPYEHIDENFSLTDIPSFRTLRSFINKFSINSLSQIEQIMRVYDEIKLMDYENNDDNIQLPEIVHKRKTNSYGMNKLFSYVLKKLGYKTFVGEVINGNVKSYVTLVDIKDSKYNLDGIYVFDPSMDNLSKETYKKDDIRRINYNFFGISLRMFERISFNDKLSGILAILGLSDFEYSKEKLDMNKSYRTSKEKDDILNTFKLDYENLYNKIRNTKPLNIDIIIKANDVLYENKKENYNDILKENYELRKEDLFIKDAEEELEEYIKNEK